MTSYSPQHQSSSFKASKQGYQYPQHTVTPCNTRSSSPTTKAPRRVHYKAASTKAIPLHTGTHTQYTHIEPGAAVLKHPLTAG